MEKTLVKPDRIHRGDRIGIVAPGGPVTREELQPGIRFLESRGYSISSAPHLYAQKGYLAGDDENRLQDLHMMFKDPEVKAILCARGGYGTLRLLDKIDYSLIRDNPKIIAGYSDITALLLALYKMNGLVTFHGPLVKDLTKNENRNMTTFLELVTSEGPMELDLHETTCLRQGRAVGPLLGGNLTLISHLVGTPYMPSLRGAILFIEDRGEPLYRIDRMLTHLHLGGILKDLAGLIAGQFEDRGDDSDIGHLLKERTYDTGIPVVTGLPLGHGDLNLPLPVGLRGSLDTEKMTLSVLEPSVSS
ncbi:MAG: LD-carboxypeptidase [Deltaproteobacteria bacterium]|nr:LD-carboxypeptidase [Deltaproteobacteria bacterium]